jgi:hypothetical protein
MFNLRYVFNKGSQPKDEYKSTLTVFDRPSTLIIIGIIILVVVFMFKK